ncbi:FeoB-associated Cys-rich membrane protein [Paenibacillus bouchesdurhonensis]|uniref:FeoB-associated Cys-rich membrane protein n=1 Tax=Paenibacillus bouchesdurhonensis TaxID=1870990 RepID=UPI000DA5F312|nr:FeoB-associated Cys-rich membrane protein [Paenibacillus bouchesdurhonensis]
MIDFIIVALVFSYAGWAVYKGFKKGKKGACASCSQQRSCSAGCDNSSAPSPDKHL